MDDESAEIELLEQNLQKTKQISQKMTAILNSFDTRMAKLEKAILPLYTSTQILNKRASNIEKTLLKIDEVASNQEGVAVEEALVLRGPQPDQLDVYRDALERLNASIAFNSSESGSLDTAHLVETGAKKLAQMYTKLVAEGSSGASPMPGEAFDLALPADLQDTLRPLVAFLRTLPLPATHPSHPAASAIMATLKEAQKGYADMRGKWCAKCLETSGKRVLDRAETIDSIASGNEFGSWTESVLTVAEDEFLILKDLAPLTTSSALKSSYSTLLNPLIVLFSTTVTSLIAFIKRSLHKYAFLALASYEHLLSMQSRWDEVLALRGNRSEGNVKEVNEFREGLTALRSICLRSFPEFLADIKLASMGSKGYADVSTGLVDFTIQTVKYLERLPEVQSAAGAALIALGDGNWKMGEGTALGPKTTKPLSQGDEPIILQHYILDIVTTAVNSLNSLSNSSKRIPAMNSIFLLNNIAYLRKNIISDPKHDSLLDLLSKQTIDMLNTNFRTAKAAYFDANFSSLLQTLGDDSSKGGKAQAKEKFTRFYDILEEITERHRVARVLDDDADGREGVQEDVVKLVVPSLQRFTQKWKDKEFSKNPQKYIKLSSEEVESRLKGLYR